MARTEYCELRNIYKYVYFPQQVRSPRSKHKQVGLGAKMVSLWYILGLYPNMAQGKLTSHCLQVSYNSLDSITREGVLSWLPQS